MEQALGVRMEEQELYQCSPARLKLMLLEAEVLIQHRASRASRDYNFLPRVRFPNEHSLAYLSPSLCQDSVVA